MRPSSTILALLAVSLLIAVAAVAEVPPLINYQGRLENSSGDPIDTTVLMAFSICSDSLGSACTWTEEHPAVVVTGGLFNVILGSITPLEISHFSGVERWLGVHVGDENLPYTRLLSAPYAQHAAVADTAEYAQGVAPNSVNGSHVVDGSLFAGDLGDELGVAFHSDPSAGDSIQDNVMAVMMVDTIQCPADGYVLVLADFIASLEHVADTPDNDYHFGLGTDSSSMSIVQSSWYFPISLPSGYYKIPVSVSRVVEVSAGQNVFYLLAADSDAPGHNEFWSRPNLILLFIPTSYAE